MDPLLAGGALEGVKNPTPGDATGADAAWIRRGSGIWALPREEEEESDE